MPSSSGSIRAIDPGRSLCHESTNECIEQTLVFRPNNTRRNQWKRESLTGAGIANPKCLGEQSSLPLFALPLPYYCSKQTKSSSSS